MSALSSKRDSIGIDLITHDEISGHLADEGVSIILFGVGRTAVDGNAAGRSHVTFGHSRIERRLFTGVCCQPLCIDCSPWFGRADLKDCNAVPGGDNIMDRARSGQQGVALQITHGEQDVLYGVSDVG